MARLSAAIGRPVTFALLQVDAAPDLWRELLALSQEALLAGADLRPQVAGRPTGLLSGHQTTFSLLDAVPAYQELKAKNLSLPELCRRLRDPEVRQAILSWQPPASEAEALDHAFARTYVLGSPPDYEPGPDRSISGIAAATRRPPREVAYDSMLTDDATGLLYMPILNYSDGDLEPARHMLMHPQAALGWVTEAPTVERSATPRCPPSCSPTGYGTGQEGPVCPWNGSSRSRPATPLAFTVWATGAPWPKG